MLHLTGASSEFNWGLVDAPAERPPLLSSPLPSSLPLSSRLLSSPLFPSPLVSSRDRSPDLAGEFYFLFRHVFERLLLVNTNKPPAAWPALRPSTPFSPGAAPAPAPSTRTRRRRYAPGSQPHVTSHRV